MLVEEVAGLHLMQRNDDILEEDDVLLPQRHCETRNDASQNVQKLRGSIELEGLVDQRVEAIVNGLTNHLSPGDQLGIETVEDVFQVFSFTRLFRVKELEEFLNERGSDVDLESLDIRSIVDDELQEELINRLKMRPGRVRQSFFLNSKRFTSSMPIPSPGRPCFLRTGRGRKIFFSTMLMTRSRWGMMTVDMQFWSLR
jgi:hypothetical protein